MPPAADPVTDDDGGPPQGWRRIETLGVAEVVMTILKARKAMPLATAASVSRERHGDGFHVQVSLMSDPSAVAVIADFIAGRLDEDLIGAFGGKDVIILE